MLSPQILMNAGKDPVMVMQTVRIQQEDLSAHVKMVILGMGKHAEVCKFCYFIEI